VAVVEGASVTPRVVVTGVDVEPEPDEDAGTDPEQAGRTTVKMQIIPVKISKKEFRLIRKFLICHPAYRTPERCKDILVSIK